MKKRVLITSVSRKVALVERFKAAGWEVIAQDIDDNAVAFQFADAALANINPSDIFDLVVPTRDAEIMEMAKQGLGVMSKPVYLVPSLATVETCLDKLEFHDFCLEHGYKTPHVYYVKPRFSSSRGKDGQVWEHVWQESISGQEISLDLFSDFNSQVISIVPRLRLKTVNGESWVTRVIWDELLVSEAKKLAEDLSLVGHNVLQCFWEKGERPVWTDVNVRFGGASNCGIEAGCDSPRWLLALVNGEKVAPVIQPPKMLTMYRYPADKFVYE